MSPARRVFRVVAAAFALVAAATAGIAAPAATSPAAAAVVKSTKTVELMAGVTFTKTVFSVPRQRNYVLTVDPASAATLDVALPRPTFGVFAATSTMAKAHGAIAAVNGDFGYYPGRPVHAFAQDGDLEQTSAMGVNNGKAFAISQDETATFVGSGAASVRLRLEPSGESWPVVNWNSGKPRQSEIAGFTGTGGQVERPPSDACAARLLPTGPRRWSNDGRGVRRDYQVDQVQCANDPMPLNGGVVLAAPKAGGGADRLKSLAPGQQVHLTWGFGWPGVADVMGGSPVLLKDGMVEVDKDCKKYLCLRHPRTAVGVLADGRVVMVVADGRQRASRGYTLWAWAKYLQSLGVVDALNLDGGGSSTMVVKGVVVNHPSDGGERLVSSALLVLPGPDAGEPVIEPSA